MSSSENSARNLQDVANDLDNIAKQLRNLGASDKVRFKTIEQFEEFHKLSETANRLRDEFDALERRLYRIDE